jgi:prepilin-type N-terminal cleavage/methylation domain-containing protein
MIRLYRSRRGFSLLEVMIATAILAASAMVVLSLISLGTRFGSKAETRIAGLVQAQSILDESILRMQAGETIESYTAVLPGTKPKSYRVTIEPYVLSETGGTGTPGATGVSGGTGASGGTGTSGGGSETMFGGFGSGGGMASARGPALTDDLQGSGASMGGVPSGSMPTELVSIKVELFESESASSAPTGVGAKGSEGRALIELTRLVRRPVVVQEDGRSTLPTEPSGRQMGL